MTTLGSSTMWPPSMAVGGFLSDNMTVNPKFANWNVAYLKYCDGASFTGRVGLDILIANMDNLKEKGIQSATDVILTGCSAGGLATYIHADFVGSYFPESSNFHALADAGYFLDVKSVTGEYVYRTAVQQLMILHNVTGGYGGNINCLESRYRNEKWKCFFAPYLFQFINSPIFMLNSEVDPAQLAGRVFELPCLPPNCSNTEMEEFFRFNIEFLDRAGPPILSRKAGVFIDSCIIHCQSITDEPWMNYEVNGLTVRDAVAAWYFGGEVALKAVDLAVWPDNKVCGSSVRPDLV